MLATHRAASCPASAHRRPACSAGRDRCASRSRIIVLRGSSSEIAVVGIDGDDLRAVAPAAVSANSICSSQGSGARCAHSCNGQPSRSSAVGLNSQPVLRLGAEDEDARAVFLVEAPVAQRPVERRGSGTDRSGPPRSPTGYSGPTGAITDRAFAPDRHAQRRIDRIAARHAPHGRAVGEDEIVDADIAERAERRVLMSRHARAHRGEFDHFGIVIVDRVAAPAGRRSRNGFRASAAAARLGGASAPAPCRRRQRRPTSAACCARSTGRNRRAGTRRASRRRSCFRLSKLRCCAVEHDIFLGDDERRSSIRRTREMRPTLSCPARVPGARRLRPAASIRSIARSRQAGSPPAARIRSVIERISSSELSIGLRSSVTKVPTPCLTTIRPSRARMRMASRRLGRLMPRLLGEFGLRNQLGSRRHLARQNLLAQRVGNALHEILAAHVGRPDLLAQTGEMVSFTASLACRLLNVASKMRPSMRLTSKV